MWEKKKHQRPGGKCVFWNQALFLRISLGVHLRQCNHLRKSEVTSRTAFVWRWFWDVLVQDWMQQCWRHWHHKTWALELRRKPQNTRKVGTSKILSENSWGLHKLWVRYFRACQSEDMWKKSEIVISTLLRLPSDSCVQSASYSTSILKPLSPKSCKALSTDDFNRSH